MGLNAVHQSCWTTWARMNPSCPICRADWADRLSLDDNIMYTNKIETPYILPLLPIFLVFYIVSSHCVYSLKAPCPCTPLRLHNLYLLRPVPPPPPIYSFGFLPLSLPRFLILVVKAFRSSVQLFDPSVLGSSNTLHSNSRQRRWWWWNVSI